jgi:hypothetical protein
LHLPYLRISQQQGQILLLVRFQILMKMAAFWVVAPFILVQVYRRFRGACCLHHQSNESVNFYQTTRHNISEDIHLRILLFTTTPGTHTAYPIGVGVSFRGIKWLGNEGTATDSYRRYRPLTFAVVKLYLYYPTTWRD